MSQKPKEVFLNTKFLFQGTNGRYKLYGYGTDRGLHALGIQVIHGGQQYERKITVNKSKDSQERHRGDNIEHQEITTVITTRTFTHPSKGNEDQRQPIVDRQPIGAVSTPGTWSLTLTKIFGEDYIVLVDGFHVVQTLGELCADDTDNTHGSSEWNITRWVGAGGTTAGSGVSIIRDIHKEVQWAFYYNPSTSPPSSGVLVVPIKCAEYTISLFDDDGKGGRYVGLGDATEDTAPLVVLPEKGFPVFWTVERSNDDSFVIYTTKLGSDRSRDIYVIAVGTDSEELQVERVSKDALFVQGARWHFASPEKQQFELGETREVTVYYEGGPSDKPSDAAKKCWTKPDINTSTIKLTHNDVDRFMLEYQSPITTQGV